MSDDDFMEDRIEAASDEQILFAQRAVQRSRDVEAAGWELVRRVEWLEHRLEQVTAERDHAREIACRYGMELGWHILDQPSMAAEVADRGMVAVVKGPAG